MPPAVYELWFWRGDVKVDRQTIAAVLDLHDPDGTADLLNRHLLAAAIRDGGDRLSAHEWLVEVWTLGDRNKEMWLRWAFPVDPEVWG
jgi:hypothetical protein